MRHLMNRKTAVPGALLAILLGPLSAYAAPPGYDVATRTVKYGDLDLGRTAGAATLYSRLQNAAQAVCEPVMSSGARDLVRLSRRCVDQALARAVADVNSPVLTNLYLMKTKQTITLARQP